MLSVDIVPTKDPVLWMEDDKESCRNCTPLGTPVDPDVNKTQLLALDKMEGSGHFVSSKSNDVSSNQNKCRDAINKLATETCCFWTATATQLHTLTMN